jgi:hypothetical protein
MIFTFYLNADPSDLSTDWIELMDPLIQGVLETGATVKIIFHHPTVRARFRKYAELHELTMQTYYKRGKYKLETLEAKEHRLRKLCDAELHFRKGHFNYFPYAGLI